MIKNETRNGIIRSHSADHGGFSIKEEMSIGSEQSVQSQGECVATTCSDLCQADSKFSFASVSKRWMFLKVSSGEDHSSAAGVNIFMPHDHAEPAVEIHIEALMVLSLSMQKETV